MSLKIEVEKKPNKTDMRKLSTPSDVYKLKEVQEIKNAIQEYFIFIGLDGRNHIRNISVLGIGTSGGMLLDSKQLIYKALLTASERVIFVHNHPSNSLEPSKEDIHLTNVTKRLMKVFNIELLDHIIVTEEDYVSMESIKAIDKKYSDDSFKFMNNAFLVEENNKLRQEIEMIKSNKLDMDDEEEEEM